MYLDTSWCFVKINGDRTTREIPRLEQIQFPLFNNKYTFLGYVFHFRLDDHEHIPQDDSFDIFTSSLIVIDWIHWDMLQTWKMAINFSSVDMAGLIGYSFEQIIYISKVVLYSFDNHWFSRYHQSLFIIVVNHTISYQLHPLYIIILIL